MNTESEEEIRNEIKQIKAISYPERSVEDMRRLNDLEAEIRRRSLLTDTGMLSSNMLSKYLSI